MENIEKSFVEAAVKVIDSFENVNQGRQLERLAGDRGVALKEAVATLRKSLRVAGHDIEPITAPVWVYNGFMV